MDIKKAKAAAMDLHELRHDINEGVTPRGDIADRLAGLAIIKVRESGCLDDQPLRMIGRLVEATENDGPAAVWKAVAEYIISDVTVGYTGLSGPSGSGERYGLVALRSLIGEIADAIEQYEAGDDEPIEEAELIETPAVKVEAVADAPQKEEAGTVEEPATPSSDQSTVLTRSIDALKQSGKWMTKTEITAVTGDNPASIKTRLAEHIRDMGSFAQVKSDQSRGYRFIGS